MSGVRDDKGRFVKGHSGNPGGRPIDQSKYLKKIDTTMTLKDWREIVKKAIDQAKRGDSRARQWLSDYLAGKPIQPIEGDFDNVVRFIVEHEDDGLPDNPTETT